nr:FeoA family protein [Senegalia massiliensis]
MENLSKAKMNVEYTIKDIETDDEEMKDFLFTLGCYEGEKVTVISVLAENYVISVKDARYSIDLELAKVIIV